MKSLSEYMNESVAQESPELGAMGAAIEKAFKKYFPNGYFGYSVRKILKPNADLNFVIGLIGDNRDVPNGIRGNDVMHHSFQVEPQGDGKYIISVLNGSLSIKPEAGSYMAMGTVKTGFRKTTGDEKKIINTVDKFFKKLQGLVREHKDNLYGVERINPKYLKV